MDLLYVLVLFGLGAVSAEYMFIHPYVMELGSQGELCLILKDLSGPGIEPDTDLEMILVLHYHHIKEKKDFVVVTGINGQGPDTNGCTSVDAPSLTGNYKLTVVAQVKYDLDGESVTLDLFKEHTQKIKVFQAGIISLIQSDKPQYKPGDTVKVRALSMDAHLQVKIDFEKFTIESPDGLLMAQWNVDKDLAAGKDTGLFTFELPLSAEPTLGMWVIKGYGKTNEKTSQTFKVQEYVLPKYEVTVEGPKFLTVTTKKVEVKVCAKYTYGKPVKGQMALEVCYRSFSYYWRGDRPTQRPCVQIFREDFDGCADIYISADRLELGNKNYSLYGNLVMNATVTEAGTGVVLSQEESGPKIYRQPLDLILEDDSNNFFKPGFPYRGRVKVQYPDGSPAPGEEIEVVAEGYFGRNAMMKKTFISDDNGMVNFVITKFLTESKVGECSLKATAIRYESENYEHFYHYWYDPSLPRAWSTLRKWTSPSSSYLYIPDIDQPVACDGSINLDVYYNSPSDATYEFTYMVQSLGKNIAVVKQVNTFDVDVDPEFTNFNPEQVLELIEEPDLPDLPTFPEIIEPEILPEMARPLGAARKRRESPVTPQNPITQTAMLFNIEQYRAKLGSEVNILVFYMREDSEIVSTNIKVPIKSCFKNKASLAFGDGESVRPGADVTMKVGASPGSSCFVGMVDKSVNLLGGYNQLTPDKIFEVIEREGTPRVWLSFYDEDEDYCKSVLPPVPPPPGPDGSYYFSPRYSHPVGVDAIQPFRDSKMWVVTDGRLQSRDCKRDRPYYAVPRMEYGLPGRAIPMVMETQVDTIATSRLDDEEPEAPAPKIRSYFPETWLWDIVNVGEEGVYSDNITVPDTITEWVGNSLCVHKSDGVAVTDITGVTVFQPFFVSLTLPYSVIRGETVPILVSVFNYLQDCLTMRITLEETDGYELSSRRSRQKEMCVCGGESKSTKFFIIPNMIGDLELIVTAVSISDIGLCSNMALSSEGIGVSDGVERQLRVEAEGVLKEVTKSSFQCVKEGAPSSFLVDMSLPSDIVIESERATVAVVGDVMGPTLSNLDNLLRMPYGCGEQNMASWAPNIYVMQYLIGTGQVTDAIRKKAERFMRSGYQRQQKYKHRDNSYSAFGENSYSNDTGSIWLTAFVVKSMAQSSPFITIDGNLVYSSIEFIRNNQLPDGCFPDVGKVFSSYMTGGLNKGYNKEGLTAFILIALLEARAMNETLGSLTWEWGVTIERAVHCLDVDFSSLDTYTLTVTTYALSLIGSDTTRLDDAIVELESRANTDGGVKYWKRAGEEEKKPENSWYRSSSADIEMTAYAMMALQNHMPEETMALLPIIQWLTKQRNPYGGFSSTQDTVVALQALSKFASATYTSDQGSVTVDVEQAGESLKLFNVSLENSLLYQSVPVRPKQGNVMFQVTGSGCALLQVAMRYNVYKEQEEGPAFRIKTEVFRSQTDKNNCARRTMRICAKTTKYLKGGVSNMAIIKIKTPTGWVALEEPLQKLRRESRIERFEVEQDIVNLYFDELTRTHTCVNFDVEQIIRLNPKPALVTVYDYYEAEYSVTQSYGIKTTCGTKQEIPLDNEGLDCTIMQCRTDDKMPTARTCPQCPARLQESDVKELACASHSVFKGFVARKGVYPIKFQSNIRHKKKEIVNDFLNFDLPKGCECPILSNSSPTKALVLMKTGDPYRHGVNTESELFLSDEVTILKLNKETESAVHEIASKPKKCTKIMRKKRKAERRRLRLSARRKRPLSRRRNL